MENRDGIYECLLTSDTDSNLAIQSLVFLSRDQKIYVKVNKSKTKKEECDWDRRNTFSCEGQTLQAII